MTPVQTEWKISIHKFALFVDGELISELDQTDCGAEKHSLYWMDC